MSPNWWPIVAVVGLIIGGIVLAEIGFPLAGCRIKGNISMYPSERIYHVPGQEFYGATRVNWAKGERWFCTEAEARQAGWRRAMR